MTKQAPIDRWNRSDLKNPHHHRDKDRRVQNMFSAIADSYDLANHVLSLNLDRRWRRKAAQLANLEPGQTVLDLCCGTGDLAFAFAENQPRLKHIIGTDFSLPMLLKAVTKTGHDRHNSTEFKWLCMDAQQCSFADEQFDRIGCAFGIRNLKDPDIGFKEIFRLLKPQGRVVILEFTLPQSRPPAWLYHFYFRLVLPLIGGIISQDRHRAYDYLVDSVRSFGGPGRVIDLMTDVGFDPVQTVALCGGIVIAYIADKQ